ncbi:MAG: hypothetical protein HOW73_24020 [Polyangiaceae bacterium]|nr:hypothetical protein [Polyangiaceae bacterium]
MKRAVAYLERALELEAGNPETQRELKAALRLLQAIESKGAALPRRFDATVLPPNATSFSEYRVMDDADTDERALWIEVRGERGPLRLSGGDLLVRFSSD